VVARSRRPEKHLDETLPVIKNYEENGEQSEAGESVMAKLRQIQDLSAVGLSTRQTSTIQKNKMANRISSTPHLYSPAKQRDQYHQQAKAFLLSRKIFPDHDCSPCCSKIGNALAKDFRKEANAGNQTAEKLRQG